jgi:hypothetical protein
LPSEAEDLLPVRVVEPLAWQVVKGNPPDATLADLTEALKVLCAEHRLNVGRHSTPVHAALRSVLKKARRDRVSAPVEEPCDQAPAAPFPRHHETPAIFRAPRETSATAAAAALEAAFLAEPAEVQAELLAEAVTHYELNHRLPLVDPVTREEHARRGALLLYRNGHRPHKTSAV